MLLHVRFQRHAVGGAAALLRAGTVAATASAAPARNGTAETEEKIYPRKGKNHKNNSRLHGIISFWQVAAGACPFPREHTLARMKIIFK
jgi:hypothetical protein